MMWQVLLWLYLVNATLLIVHEIDSAYWKEWELFRLPGGPGLFLLLHLPLVFLILWGLLAVSGQTRAGLLISLLLAAGGIFAFGIHTYFIKKGHPEFRSLVSRGLLAAMLPVSLVQGWVSIALWFG
jgi:hypothetical protein